MLCKVVISYDTFFFYFSDNQDYVLVLSSTQQSLVSSESFLKYHYEDIGFIDLQFGKWFRCEQWLKKCNDSHFLK